MRTALLEVAETICNGLEHREGLDVGLFLRGVHATRSERDFHILTSVLRCLLDAGGTAENDQVRERHLLAAGLRLVELTLHTFECLQDARQLFRLIGLPAFLRRETNARAVGAAALVRAPERGRRCPRRRHELRDRQARRENLALE